MEFREFRDRIYYQSSRVQLRRERTEDWVLLLSEQGDYQSVASFGKQYGLDPCTPGTTFLGYPIQVCPYISHSLLVPKSIADRVRDGDRSVETFLHLLCE